jgi:ketosteroid isomerase-like protein
MPTDENKAVVRRLMEETSRGNLAVIDELIAPDFVFHNPSDPSVGGGPEGYRRWTTQRRGDLGDDRVTIEDQLAEGDKVATRFTVRATHAGTGTVVTITVIAIDHLRDGRLVGHWDEADALGMLQQIGELPAAGPPTS